MGKIVVKFGGSNLKTPGDIKRSAAVAGAYRQNLVVVVSAFYGVTDLLTGAIGEALVSLDGIKEAMALIRKRHCGVIEQTIAGRDTAENTAAVIEGRMASLERLLTGIHYIGAVPDFTRDTILSYGERLSAPILTAVLEASGLAAREALPERIGLMTDGRFGNASADMDYSAPRIREALSGDFTFVVPGFYGTTGDGGTAVFGRGGSDYTAAVTARAIGAPSLDLWKDVDGFLSSDPRITGTSRTIPYLSYAEAAELAYFGAKILHPRTVEPLEDTAIPVRVMNVEKFAGEIHPYSIVGPEKGTIAAGADEAAESGSGHRQRIIKSVASSDDVGIIRIEGPGVGSRPGILARATGKLDAAGVNISSVITAQTCINLIFRRGDTEKALAVVKSESISGVVSVEALDDCAMVAAVGSGIRDSVGVGSRILGALADAAVNIILVQAGASPVAVYVIVRREDRERAVTAIHNAMGRIHEGT
ncbi:aspartate kinase [Breznakiella homolactica]|uniref:Aspartokinase n=1 Tax=Breznakiella homolactica TaxID=2798577 RepID=A0A7T7XJR1_9SPIR|nr:aspartate kinase [Breznakiella homolactica]QQO07492.1 aspartate kinase [Breznakiella homolactica]